MRHLPEAFHPEAAASSVLFAALQGDVVVVAGDRRGDWTRQSERSKGEAMTELMTPKVDKARMLAWLEQARKVGEWPASLDQGREKFVETYDALVELVNRTHLKIEVVHKWNEPGPGDNHRPAGEESKEPWLDSALRTKS
jgi:hypothetical protein